MHVRSLVAGVVVLAMSGTSYGWGHQGHEVIGAIADKMLGANATSQVNSILGKKLEIAARWPDCVKDVDRNPDGTFTYKPMPQYHAACAVFETAPGIARMEDYVKRNYDTCTPGPPGADPCHKQYHYADVAIQHDHYDRAFVGTSDHDIVSAMEAAIALLRDKPAPAPFSIVDKQEALLMLAHFVGDVHQPLHVGAVYIGANNHKIDPDAPGHTFDPKTETRGGNSIDDGTTNLHSEWDTIASSIKPSAISSSMMTAAHAVAVTPGDPNTWPTAWASETIIVSTEPFTGISFTKTATTKPGHWKAKFANRTAYLAAKSTLQRAQLAKGGARLAQLLNAIWP